MVGLSVRPVLFHLRLGLLNVGHGLGDGVAGAGLGADDRLGVPGDLADIRLHAVVEALSFVQSRVDLRLEPARELLFAVRDEGLGQVPVLGGRGLPLVPGRCPARRCAWAA